MIGLASEPRGTLLTGRNDGVGLTAVNDGNGVSTNHLVKHQLDGREQIEVLTDHDILDELNQHFGIRIRDELHALVDEFRFQVGIVLYDTVVDQRKITGFRVMWMCITR